MLKERDEVAAFALMMSPDGAIGIAVAAVGDSESAVAMLTDGLRRKAEEGSMNACAVCSPRGSSALTVMLENNENYCADILLPFVGASPREIDMDGILVEDGAVRVFGLVE